ncbi:GNAT family N-acetyltransferase [Nocardiopsis aegyptia]|uniref:GNAT superfamily N-acetyltransferase n=1 Tax=Nocardiopsis aegyptia TaxID=220378 RepID=A0A7Z0J9V9_9ACTN|nr:GNAT family N-acetyltransferase [Nocardiopsis aegyptia]NYJ34486.1 GNAT superfamily N-acetyltransferase [Nocardiopsis aegyptia]
MSDKVEIRPREEQDLDACARLLVEVHERDGYPVEGVADPRKWLELDGSGRAWVALAEGAVAGHVSLTRTSSDDAVKLWKAQNSDRQRPVASVGRLFVSPAVRGRGAALALMRRAMEFGREQGWQLVLDVMEKDQAAMRLYERLGWVCIGTIVHRFGEGQEIPGRAYALSC